MCLKSKNEVKVADEPIVCYKVLCVWNRVDSYWSPFRHKQYDIGETYECSGMVSGSFHWNGWMFYFDGFHMCPDMESVCRYMENLIEFSDKRMLEKLERMVIAKCVIPSGAMYVEGEDDVYGIPGFVCSKFVFDSVIEERTKIT